MKIICYYNKNLKMSEGKLASQVGHVCKELGKILWYQFMDPPRVEDKIIVLGLRQNKFKEKFSDVQNENFFYAQGDLGLTEVDKNTITAFGYIEQGVVHKDKKNDTATTAVIIDEIGQFNFKRMEYGSGWTCVPSIIKTKYNGNES